ncbi:MAG: DUF3857 domain-containing protein [Taibaiella sp.]|nr:DUF3857 domain-containing protein [Taibaiella sp.]
MKSIFVAVACLFLLCFRLNAREYDKKFINEQLHIKYGTDDKDATEVVLYEKGTVRIDNGPEGMRQGYAIHRIIRVLKAPATPGRHKYVYRNDNSKSAFVANMKATTYNLDGEKITETRLENTTVENDMVDNNHSSISFAMPGVKDGSIIEYHFEIVSPLHEYLPEWEFKGKLPKIKSEFEVNAPAGIKFTEAWGLAALPETFDSVQAAEAKNAQYYKVQKSGPKNTVRMLWSMANVPAIKKEPFITAVEDYRELLQLKLAGSGENELQTTWKSLDSELYHHDFFGKVTRPGGGRLKTFVDSITRDDATAEQKARRIYTYVRYNFECNNNPGLYSRREAEQIFKNRIASAAEINLLLTALLKLARLDAAPVIISKIGDPKASERYPVVNRFNYTVSIAKIDGKNYYMDGSNQYNTFGILPVYCYGGYARVIAERGYGLALPGKDFKDNSGVAVTLSNISDTAMFVDVTEKKGMIEAGYLRNVLNSDTSALRAYINRRIQGFPGQQLIVSFLADNISDPDRELVIRYRLYSKRKPANPFTLPADYLKLFSGNPFTAAERRLPVEFPSAFDFTYTLTVQLPDGVKPVNVPVDYTGNVSENAWAFSHNYNYEKSASKLTVTTRTLINDPTLPASAYAELKALFDKMLTEESAVLTFKKK